jgi:hypothetical protein
MIVVVTNTILVEVPAVGVEVTNTIDGSILTLTMAVVPDVELGTGKPILEPEEN